MLIVLFFFFFFQAEDGIRDLTVTGVQTCALPIWTRQLVLVEDPESHAGSSPALRRPAIEQALQHHPPLLRLRPEAPSGQPAVDHERVTVHEARLITGQPQRRVRDVLGQAGPADRLEHLEDALHERDRRLGLVRREPEGLAEDRRRDAARTDAVDPRRARRAPWRRSG